MSGAVGAVGEAGAYLGVLLQNLSAAFDPGCIVLGGELVNLGDAFLEPALHTLRRYSTAANVDAPEVRVSSFGSDAVAIGAAALARYHLMRPLVARRGPIAVPTATAALHQPLGSFA